MALITPEEAIDIEQQVVIAVLDSVLRPKGTERAPVLAKRARVSAVYLSYIRHGHHFPRGQTAERIASALPLSPEQQQAWLYHVQRVWELKRHERERLAEEVLDRPVEELVNPIKQMHGAATFASEPALARSRYRQVKIAAESLLHFVNPERDPVNYVELCLLMHEALSVLNRNDEGLWYGKRARRVAESIDDPRVYNMDRERLDFFVVNTIRAEAVSYHNLKLYRQARKLCEYAEGTGALKRHARFWKPHLYRDTINAMEGIPRFSITEAENLAEQVEDICDRRGDSSDGLLSFLIQASLARAFIKHGNLKDAYRALSRNWDRLHTTTNLGPLHQVIFLRTFARYYAAQDAHGADRDYFVREAVRIASEAGLEHQSNELRLEFGIGSDQHPAI